MKKSFLPILILMIGMVFSSCEKLFNDDSTDDEDNTTVVEKLYVKFLNEGASVYDITSIETRTRGAVDKENQPIGNWESNVLSDGKILSPGDSVLFYLEIPSGHWRQYRLTVKDQAGALYQVGEDSELPITHWGADTRTVYVVVSKDNQTNLPYIQGWGDWAGM